MVKKKLALLLPVVIVTIIVVFFKFTLDNKETITQANIKQKPFPAFALKDLQDKHLLNEEIFLEQQYTLLNVWASWCVVCKTEHPFLLKLAEQGINIVGLNYRDNNKSALAVLNNTGDPYRHVIFDKQGGLALDLGVVGTPETYLVNQQGIIVARFNGVLTEKVWKVIFEPNISKINNSKGS